MQPKKRISKSSPSYFIPLPYAMAVKKVLSDKEMNDHLFEGMQLTLEVKGIVSTTIEIKAFFLGQYHVIGYIPNGMISRVEGVLEHDMKIVVSLERIHCERLPKAFWICIDELPDLAGLDIQSFY